MRYIANILLILILVSVCVLLKVCETWRQNSNNKSLFLLTSTMCLHIYLCIHTYTYIVNLYKIMCIITCTNILFLSPIHARARAHRALYNSIRCSVQKHEKTYTLKHTSSAKSVVVLINKARNYCIS